MDDRPRTHACETPHPLYGGSFPLSAITSAQPPWMTFAPRIIYGQGQDTRAHNNWPSPGPPGTTNKVTGEWSCALPRRPGAECGRIRTGDGHTVARENTCSRSVR